MRIRKTRGISAHKLDGPAFAQIRTRLGKTRRELAELLGVSAKAVESYEQGWRNVPGHVERVLYYLLCKLSGKGSGSARPCWSAKKCPSEHRAKCIAFAVKEGAYCWFFTGRLCSRAAGTSPRSGAAESGLGACYSCEVFSDMLNRTGVF